MARSCESTGGGLSPPCPSRSLGPRVALCALGADIRAPLGDTEAHLSRGVRSLDRGSLGADHAARQHPEVLAGRPQVGLDGPNQGNRHGSAVAPFQLAEPNGTCAPSVGLATRRPRTPSGYFVAVIRAPPGTRKTILSTDPWSQRPTLSALVLNCPLLSAPGIPLPKLNVEGSSPFARST